MHWGWAIAGAAAVVAAVVWRAAVARACDAALARLDDLADLGRRSPRWRDSAAAVLLLGPALLILTVFGFLPLLGAFYMSLYQGIGPDARLVWTGNYIEAVGAADFWQSVLVTLYYIVGTVPLSLGLSLLVAVALVRLGRGRGFFRTAYFLPYVTSVVAAALVWRGLLHPQFGVANAVLEALGQPGQRWLLEPRGVLHLLTGGAVSPRVGPSLALCCVIAFDIWHAMGYMIVILMAGLMAIPRDLEEAAAINGANRWQTLRHVTLPLLSPSIFFLLIISVIRSFQAFSSFYALTGDGRGPLNTTQNLTVYLYTSFYEFGRPGYGAAVAAILCVAIVAVTLVQWRVIGRRVHYE